MPVAERALELAGTSATDPERLFIRASYLKLNGKVEEVIPTLQALLQLQPGNFWATNNLIIQLRNEGRLPEAASYAARCADVRPMDAITSVRAGSLLYALGQPSAASYLHRAETIVRAESPDSPIRASAEVTWLALLPAFEAWLRDDAAAALRLVNAEWAKARSDRIDDRTLVLGNWVTLGLQPAKRNENPVAASP